MRFRVPELHTIRSLLIRGGILLRALVSPAVYREFIRTRVLQIHALRNILIWAGTLLAVWGFFLLTPWPEWMIINWHIGHDEIINVETEAAFILAGTFSVVFGYGMVVLAIFFPDMIRKALALPRRELLYGISLFGTNILLFFGLALGIRSMIAYQMIIIVVFVGIAIFFIERYLSRYVAMLYKVLFNRWVAFPAYIAAGTFFFTLRFPFETFNRYVFSRDFPMFQYTMLLDWKVFKTGFPYGWEPAFSCGYPTFLNLRSILIPYLPFLAFPPALGFHLMFFLTYLAVPFLLYWIAKEISGDRDIAVMSGWAGVGAMTTYLWHILNWGMMPTFESIPFFLLTLGFFIRAMKGSRWGVFLSALFWAPVAYIHLGHFAHVGLALVVVAGVYAYEERNLRSTKALVSTGILTMLLSAPYLILFAHYRSHVILTNMYSYPIDTLMGMVRSFLVTVSHFVPSLIWDWRGYFDSRALPDYGYFALSTVFGLVIIYLVFGGDKSDRRAGVLYAGVIAVSALSFIPKFELSFQRMLYFVPLLMALALGFWMAMAKKRGHLLPFYILLTLLLFYTRYWWLDDRQLPTLPDRGAFDPAVAEKVKTLEGNYILFEDTASLSPYPDADKDYEKSDEAWDVHGEGFLHMATGKRFFSHPGYNPHPYYDLRSTYIATGTFNGKDVKDYPPEFFKDLFRKWGVEYLVLWTKQSNAYFGGDHDYEKVLDGVHYSIYRFTKADPRAVVTDGGSGEVDYPDNVTAVITVKGATPGTPVALRANYFPEWRAECDGKPVPLSNADGQIAFAAPASDCTVTLKWPQHQGYFLIPILALLAGLALSASKKL